MALRKRYAGEKLPVPRDVLSFILITKKIQTGLIFMGKFDDVRYVEEMKEEFGLKPKATPSKTKEKMKYTKALGDKGIAKGSPLAKMMLHLDMTASDQAEYAIALDHKQASK